MGLGEVYAKPAFQCRDIKTFSVVGNKHFVIPDVFCKVVKVAAIYIATDLAAVIQGNGGDFSIWLKACGLNVEEGCLLAEVGKEAPLLISRKAAAEKIIKQLK